MGLLETHRQKPEDDRKYTAAVRACAQNAERLFEDAKYLSEMDRHEATFQMAILAQEECAKTFLLMLINEGILPWTTQIERSMRNHECKHLVGIIMWWLNPSFEEVMERSKEWAGDAVELPAEVMDAIQLLRHEKIGRWISQSWEWDQDPQWNRQALKVSEGKTERQKQRAVYAHVSQDGAYQLPKVTKEEADNEYRRAEQMVEIARRQWVMSFREERAVREAMKAIFADLWPKDAQQAPSH